MLFVLLIILPLVILNLFIVVIQTDETIQQYKSEYKYEYYDIPSNLTNQLEVAFSYATAINDDYNIHNFLSKNYIDYHSFYESSEVLTKQLLNMSTYDNISVPVLYSYNASIFDSPITVRISEKIENEDWFIAYQESGSDSFLYFHEQSKNAYVIQNLDYFEHSEYEQFVMLTIDLDYVSRALAQVPLNSSAMLFNDKNEMIYRWDEGRVPTYETDFYAQLEEDFYDGKFNFEKSDMALVYSDTIDSYGDVKFIVSLNRPFPVTIDIVILFVLTLAIPLLASFFFMKKIQKDYIYRIEGIVSNIDVDDLISEKNNLSKNHVTAVEQTLNEMSEKIKNLLKTSFDLEMAKNQAEIKRKQSELNSLLSQINPHYLFNVLNAIRLKSVIKGEKETAKIILYVAKTLRRSITWSQDIITLKEELSFIQEYLTIEKYRFEDKLEFFIESDELSLLCNIPKMSLQPFVENACVHGIQNLLDIGAINIKTYVENELLHVVISNPVSSFSSQIKDQIINYSKGNFEIDTKSVGLKNTFGRLRLYYNKIHFDIDTSVENYVTMTLKIPTKVDNISISNNENMKISE